MISILGVGCWFVFFRGKGNARRDLLTEAGVGWIHAALCRVLSMDVLHRHTRQPSFALVLELAP
jgi:hypothetical protein